MYTSYFDSETMQSILKQWFEIISEKLRKETLKYSKAKRIKIKKFLGKSDTHSLIINNPKIKVIERPFFNVLEPHFEGIFK